MSGERSASGRPICEQTGKVSFTSVRDARKAMMSGAKGQHMRVYQCTRNRSHYHTTKNNLERMVSRRRARSRQQSSPGIG